VLLRHPLPKYSFQATKRKVKTDGKKNEVKRSEEKDRNDNVPLPVGTVKPVSKVEPYLADGGITVAITPINNTHTCINEIENDFFLYT
jgi:hypothetical protein